MAYVNRYLEMWIQIGMTVENLDTCMMADWNAEKYNWGMLSVVRVFPHILVDKAQTTVSY